MDLKDLEIVRGAEFSECLTYRYTLERTWDPRKPTVVFVLLNPSTADQYVDDPTNVRGMGFARRWGMGRCVFVNLFAWRTPHPDLMKMVSEPVGPDNDMHLTYWASNADTLVFAWGTNGPHRGRDKEVIELLAAFQPQCLGRTKHGHPKHILYLKSTPELEAYP